MRILGCLLVCCAAISLPAAGDLPLSGIGHAAYLVSDLAKADAFYRDVLGFERALELKNPAGQINMVYYKVNDHQFLEIFPILKPGQDERFSHVCLETADIDRLHAMLRQRGLNPPAVVDGRDGTRRFIIQDPEGTRIEFQQYLPGSAQVKARSVPTPRRISTRLRHVGIKIKDEAAAMKFYRDTLGFTETWRGGPEAGPVRWINLRMPGPSGDYLELMLYDTPPTKAQLGSMHHICLEVDDIQKPWAELKARGVPDLERHRPRIGRNQRWLLNLFDADGTRTELMEPRTVPPRP